MRPSVTTMRSVFGMHVPSLPGKYIRTPAKRSRNAYTPKSVPRLKHGCQIASSGSAAVASTLETSSSFPTMRTTSPFASMTYPSRSCGVARPPRSCAPPNTIAVFPSVRCATTGNASPRTPFKKKFSSSAASRVAYAALFGKTISEPRSMTTSAFAAVLAAKNAKSAKRI